MIEYKTAGESHGKGFVVIISGIPAGLRLAASDINFYLARRQMGYGRGLRTKKIEKDAVEIISGVRWGETIGSPISFFIKNKDWENWREIMSEVPQNLSEEIFLTKPRPGHADFAGFLKFGRKDIRDVLERASARETVSRVAAGAVAIKFINEFSIKVHSFTKEIGGIRAPAVKLEWDEIVRKTASSPVRCIDEDVSQKMIKAIDDAASRGDTLGGIFTVVVWGVPPGFGSYTEWDKRLDGNLARALMAIPSVKGVEIGRGVSVARLPGSRLHDAIYYDEKKGVYRKTNNAGGLEGGVTNGEPIIARAIMKPISSLRKPLESFNVKTMQSSLAEIIRSDVCAVPSAGVIGEAVTSIEIANALLEKLGGDTMEDTKKSFENYLKRISNYWRR